MTGQRVLIAGYVERETRLTDRSDTCRDELRIRTYQVLYNGWYELRDLLLVYLCIKHFQTVGFPHIPSSSGAGNCSDPVIPQDPLCRIIVPSIGLSRFEVRIFQLICRCERSSVQSVSLCSYGHWVWTEFPAPYRSVVQTFLLFIEVGFSSHLSCPSLRCYYIPLTCGNRVKVDSISRIHQVSDLPTKGCSSFCNVGQHGRWRQASTLCHGIVTTYQRT